MRFSTIPPIPFSERIAGLRLLLSAFAIFFEDYFRASPR